MREQCKKNRQPGSGQMGPEREGRCWLVYQMRGSKNANYLKMYYFTEKNIS